MGQIGQTRAIVQRPRCCQLPMHKNRYQDGFLFLWVLLRGSSAMLVSGSIVRITVIKYYALAAVPLTTNSR